MSQNYKIIGRTKEAIMELASRGWSRKRIYDHIGIAPKLLNEIMDYDPVSVNIQQVTVDKLENFLEQRLQEGEAKVSGEQIIEGMVEPFVDDKVEAEFVLTREHRNNELRSYTLTGTEMDLLKSVTEIFQEKGYRLDINISKIYKPDE